MKFYLFACVVVLALMSCSQSPPIQNLYGRWQVDSAYTYYNGFSNMHLDRSLWAEYEYESDGKMKEHKEGSFLTYKFELEGDSLIHRKLNGDRFQVYEILQLETSKMVLKKPRPTIFGGRNQERYEVRFFSKMKD